jgi:hypothetical protein
MVLSTRALSLEDRCGDAHAAHDRFLLATRQFNEVQRTICINTVTHAPAIPTIWVTFRFTHGVVPRDTRSPAVACEAHQTGHSNVANRQGSPQREAP